MHILTDFNKDNWDETWVNWAKGLGTPVILDYGCHPTTEALVVEGRSPTANHFFNVITTIVQGIDAGSWVYLSAGRRLSQVKIVKNKLVIPVKERRNLDVLLAPIVNLESRAKFGGLLKNAPLYGSEFLIGQTNIWDFFYGFLDYALTVGNIEPQEALGDLAVNMFAVMYGCVAPFGEEENAGESLSAPGD